jgi:hypothetical protein
MWGVIIADWIFLAAMKYVNWTRSLSRMDRKYSFKQTILEMFSFRLIHSYLLFLATMTFFIVYFISTDQYYLLIPTASIGMGFMLNFLGNITELSHYIVSGCWMILAGIVIIIAGTIPAPLAIIISLGVGITIFAIHSYISDPLREK